MIDVITIRPVPDTGTGIVDQLRHTRRDRDVEYVEINYKSIVISATAEDVSIARM